MTGVEWITLAVLLGALVMFVRELFPVGVTGVCIIAALGISGVLSPHQTVDCFANPAVVLVGALYVVSASLIRTGVIDALESRMLRAGGNSPRRLIVLSTLGACAASSVLNNTSIVVLMLPILMSAARRADIPPSRLLIPLSYAAILGGSTTLIGTSTNVLVAGLAEGAFTIRFLDFFPVGIAFVGVGLLYIWTIGIRLLPARPTVSSITRGRSIEFVTEFRVPSSGPAIGMSFPELAVRAGSKIRLLQILRGEAVLDPTTTEDALESGDFIVLRGQAVQILELRTALELVALPAAHEDDVGAPVGTTFAELVVTPESSLLAKNLVDLGLHRTYGVVALALQRRGSHLRHGITEVPLRAGDVILVQGSPEAVARLRELPGIILLTGVEQEIVVRRRAPIAATIMVLFIVGAATGAAELPLLALAAFAACLLTRCISLRAALDSINWNVLFLLAGAIALGLGLQSSGLAERIAGFALSFTGDNGPLVTLAVLYVITSVFTELISNAGSAALMVPIAIAAAQKGGWNVEPFVFATAYAASASFATPIGYHTNTFIHGPGGYRFADFLRVGAPLQLLLAAVALFLIPKFYPFFG